MTARSTSAHVTPGRNVSNATCCAATACSKRKRALSLGGPITIPRSSSALYPHTAAPEDDVVRDRVRPGAATADLAAVTRLRAVVRPELRQPGQRLEHCPRRLGARAQARLRLGHAGARVLLQEAVRMRAPASALADQLDLGRALARDHVLDPLAHVDDLRARHLAQRRPLVAEDAGVAVLVDGDRPREAEIGDDAREDLQRMLEARVLGIRLDARKRRLGTRALDL